MPKKTSKRTRKKKPVSFWSTYKVNIIGLVVFLLGICGILKAGILGNLTINTVRLVVGNLYWIGLVLLVIVGVWLLVTTSLPNLPARITIGLASILLGTLEWLSLIQYKVMNTPDNLINSTWQRIIGDFTSLNFNSDVGGGMIGAITFTVIHALLGKPGVILVIGLLILSGITLIFNINWRTVFNYLNDSFNSLAKDTSEKFQVSKATESVPEPSRVLPSDNLDVAKETIPAFKEKELDISVSTPKSKTPALKDAKENPTTEIKQEELPINFTNVDDSDYQLPPINLLTQIENKDQTNELKLIDKNAKILQQTLDSFGVKAEIKHVSLGPSVTKYELHPAIGVKVSKIVNLSDDIALALAAKGIRIEAPIPGKSLIGIEVPNQEIAMVSFRDVIENQPEQHGKLLQVPLGKDVNGNIITADLSEMPHLLIAGSTGSGKSVAINGIITSILMNAKPSEVKMMLIDPKKVELGVYNGIPHLLSPVVSEPKKAARALQKVVSEMENRYELFAKYGQRKITTYNEFVVKHNQENADKLQLMPYIVVVVDELADLMMTVSNDVEAAIIRLAQMGRAAGIHMILATQRPSVDVITGLIKANVPSRIAFAVSSGIDSRTILDSNGAEKLLGKGDMLFLPIDKNTPTRVQGAFIPDQDVQKVVDFIKNEQAVEYDENMLVSDEEIQEESNNDSDSEDELFDEVLNFVVDQQKASTSLLQRRFRIGYNRAARLIDDLEQRGYISPQDGSRPRKVYKQKSE